MPTLTKEHVKKIAHLARLAINDNEIDHYAENLSKILGFVKQMDAANIAHTEPMAHPQDLTQRLREDCVTASDQRELFQSTAPQIEAGLYLVPPVIE